jgi:3-deoxy-7-phosphoheptulonate synthase
LNPSLDSSTTWSPASWQSRKAVQQPVYDDPNEVAAVLGQLAKLPPLVTSWEVSALKEQIAEAAAGKRFVLQGGDCAEQYAECTSASITSKLKILLQMSLVLVLGGKRPVTRLGRFAGQYAKPRSEDMETQDGVTLPSYRGDLVNRPPFNAESRRPDPQLLLRGYERAALTLNFIRSLAKGGFADLHHPEYWDLDFVQHSSMAEEFHRFTGTLSEALRFMENILGVHPGEINKVDFYTSHEALLLHYEQAQTRQVPRRPGWFNLSTHFPWIGVRTADPAGAHVEYFRGIANPIGVKIGPAMGRDQILRLIDILHPVNEPGRLTFIHRFGLERIADSLPRLVEIVRSSGRGVLFICDPMHGNTQTTASGIKTRDFAHILGELEQAFRIHAAHSTWLGGVHFELTGENVTECIGGARGLSEGDLSRAYRSEVDPRLNYEQAMELALLIARQMAAGNGA